MSEVEIISKVQKVIDCMKGKVTCVLSPVDQLQELKKILIIDKAVKEWKSSKPKDYNEFIVYVSYDKNDDVGFKLSNGCKVGPYDPEFAV